MKTTTHAGITAHTKTTASGADRWTITFPEVLFDSQFKYVSDTGRPSDLHIVHDEMERLALDRLAFLRARNACDCKEIVSISDSLTNLSLQRQQDRIAAQRANKETV